MIEGGAKNDSADAPADGLDEDDAESGVVVKSAAQKKKEKKERQKQDKLQVYIISNRHKNLIKCLV